MARIDLDENDRDALTVAVRLARLAEQVERGEMDGTLEEYDAVRRWIDAALFNGAGAFERSAVVACLEGIANRYDAVSDAEGGEPWSG